jgi:NADP-dependent 3-hydroxy acid dehydrogenase YdfG
MVRTEEFSLVRYDGDQAKADAVYAGVPGPLTAEDVAEAVRWTLSLPPHVDVDELVIRPRAQASAQRVDRHA